MGLEQVRVSGVERATRKCRTCPFVMPLFRYATSPFRQRLFDCSLRSLTCSQQRNILVGRPSPFFGRTPPPLRWRAGTFGLLTLRPPLAYCRRSPEEGRRPTYE